MSASMTSTTALTISSADDNLLLPLPTGKVRDESITATADMSASTCTLSSRECHIKRVQFGVIPQVTVHSIRGEHKKHEISAKWYSKEDLKMLLDYEIRISTRCHNKEVVGKKMGRFCCARGLEHQLDTALQGKCEATLRRAEYIKVVLLMQDQLRQQLLSLEAVSKKLKRQCQAHTKADRKKAYSLGLQDASDVKFINASESGLLAMESASDSTRYSLFTRKTMGSASQHAIVTNRKSLVTTSLPPPTLARPTLVSSKMRLAPSTKSKRDDGRLSLVRMLGRTFIPKPQS